MRKHFVFLALFIFTGPVYGVRCAEAMKEFISIEPPMDGVFREYELNPGLHLLLSQFQSKVLGHRVAFGIKHNGRLAYLSKRYRRPQLIDNELVFTTSAMKVKKEGGYMRFVLRIPSDWSKEGMVHPLAFILETQHKRSKFSDWGRPKTIGFNEGGKLKYLNSFPTELRSINRGMFSTPRVTGTLFDQPFYEANLR